ncbi:MAG TPA: type II secretion system protein N [Gammaproteobacteria bacterium]|nr:type II secretion system protein N [Gammaproteobacteria bacterium]
MRWRVGCWWLAGLLAYLVFLLATLPAVYPLAWWQRRVHDVQLSKISGSVWSGAAQEFTLNGQPWGALQWHIDWRALFTGHMGYHLELRAPDIELQGRVAGTRDDFLLQDVRGHIPVRRLEALLPLPAGSVSGNLNMDLNRVLLIKMQPVLTDGVVNLTDASLSWPQNLTLGNYQLKLTSQNQKGISGSFMDTSGPLVVQGTLSLTPKGRYQVSGTLTSRDPNNAALTKLLGYLPGDEAGHHPFKLSGQW